jgi:predicted phosphodiesterase
VKIVVLGDVHANLPALRRALEEADAEGYDRIVHTGDLVGFGPHPTEVVDLIRSRGIPGVRGNHDEAVAAGEDEPRAPLLDPETTRLAAEALRWTRGRISLSARRGLMDLPFEYRVSDGRSSIALYHANPFDLRTYVPPRAPAPRLQEIASASGAEVTVLSHGHAPFHRDLLAAHVVGAGSVGAPRDGDPRGCYAVIHAGGRVQVVHRRFAYDVEETVRALAAAGLPGALAERLRRGR